MLLIWSGDVQSLSAPVQTSVSTSSDKSTGELPPGLEIIEFRWKRVFGLPRGWDSTDYSAANRSSVGSGGTFRRRRAFPAGKRSPIYIYSVKLKNSDEKSIIGIAWEYRVDDPATRLELGKRPFWTFKKIEEDKTATIEGTSTSPPSHTVSAAGAAKAEADEKDGERSPYAERAIIKCVAYEDGSIWSGPTATESDCRRLKRGLSRVEALDRMIVVQAGRR
jgi:hypothetical protein